MKTDEERLIEAIEKIAKENLPAFLKGDKVLLPLNSVWEGGFIAGYINRMRFELKKSKNSKNEN
jgi:hypothetical protein